MGIFVQAGRLFLCVAGVLTAAQTAADNYVPKRKPGQTWVIITRLGDIKAIDPEARNVVARVGSTGPRSVKKASTVTLVIPKNTRFYDVKGGIDGRPKSVKVPLGQLDQFQADRGEANIICVGAMRGSRFVVSSAYFSFSDYTPGRPRPVLPKAPEAVTPEPTPTVGAVAPPSDPGVSPKFPAGIPAGVVTAYAEMAGAFREKKPEQVMAHWAPDYSTSAGWAGKKGDLTRPAADQDLQATFPGHVYNGTPSPLEMYFLRKARKVNNGVRVDLLAYRIASTNPKGEFLGNADGVSHFVDTWVPGPDHRWLLKTRVLIIPPRAGQSKRTDLQALQVLEAAFNEAQNAGRVIDGISSK